jgi:hypothetical protein
VNLSRFFPSVGAELNFLPVFLAAALVPEVTFNETLAYGLAAPLFFTATIFANSNAPLRLAMGIIPLLFVFSLVRHLRRRNQELIPPNLAYRALQLFFCFSVVQTIHLNLIPIIPRWLTDILTILIPRYMDQTYDSAGVRGVQGWASEPSGAALTCAAFAIVAIFQRPDRRWRVLFLFALLAAVNKSIYAILLAILFAFGCFLKLKHKKFAAFVALPVVTSFVFYFSRSGRVTELYEHIIVSGMSLSANSEFWRFGQIFYPLLQFPHIYTPIPVTLNGMAVTVEPLGLAPLVVGYGSICGLAWLGYVLLRNFRPSQVKDRYFAFIAALSVLMLGPSDLIPSVVALSVFIVYPRPPRTSSAEVTAA